MSSVAWHGNIKHQTSIMCKDDWACSQSVQHPFHHNLEPGHEEGSVLMIIYDATAKCPRLMPTYSCLSNQEVILPHPPPTRLHELKDC